MLGIVVGLTAEARIAARLGGLVRAGGGTAAGALDAAGSLVERGVSGLISFGLAGGLDPALRPGVVIVPRVVLSGHEAFGADALLADRFGGLTGHVILGGGEIAATVAAKRHLHASTGAHAVDLESGSVARVARAAGLPFVAVRAICDPAERSLPPAALIALRPGGRIGLAAVLGSVLARPGQVPGLLALARDAAAGRRALVALTDRVCGMG